MNIPWAIGALTLAAYALTGGGHLYTTDEEIVFRVARALAHGQGAAIEPLAGFATRPAHPPRPDGREYAQYGLGQPLAAVPLVWLGEALARWGDDALWQRLYGRPAFGPDVLGFAPTASELAPRWACSWFNSVVGALLAMVLAMAAYEMTGSAGAARAAAILYALGTMAWPHSRTFFTEPLATLGAAAAWLALLRAARGPRIAAWCLAAGVAAAYGILTRLDTVLVLPALAVLLLGPVRAAGRGAGVALWRPVGAFAAPVAATGALILALNWLRFGSLLATGYEDQPEGVAFSTPLAAGLFGLLFSVGRGLFFFSPALLSSLWGWRPLAESGGLRGRWWVAATALAVIVPLAAHAKWQNWAGGWCWGPRHIFIVHWFLALPAAAWLARAPGAARRIALPVLLTVGAAVQLLGCSQDFIAFYVRFFRPPLSSETFRVMYDDYDAQIWSAHYPLLVPSPGQPGRLARNFPPAPIQDSLYHPQRSVWAAYPRMIRDGMIDNFWVNLVRRPSAAEDRR